jgi:hypothetical protein
MKINPFILQIASVISFPGPRIKSKYDITFHRLNRFVTSFDKLMGNKPKIVEPGAAKRF